MAKQYRTQYDIYSSVDDLSSYTSSSSGSPVRKIFEGFYDDVGVIRLKEVGRDNIYDYIQSHRDSVDIHVLLSRYRNGELDALDRIDGIYGDFTAVPSSYAEMLNTVIRGENEFYKLPLEVREKFNHNFGEFVAAMGHPDFYERAGFAPSVEPVSGEAAVSDVEVKGEE